MDMVAVWSADHGGNRKRTGHDPLRSVRRSGLRRKSLALNLLLGPNPDQQKTGAQTDDCLPPFFISLVRPAGFEGQDSENSKIS